MKKVIIFHISQFGGHSKVAQNIEEALLYKRPRMHILSMNGLGYFYPLWEKTVDYAYTTLIKHLPSIWGKVYDRHDVVKNVNYLRKIANRKTFKKLNSLIEAFRPNYFVATQAFPCGIVADFKQKYGLKVPLAAIVTDYYPNRFWIHPFVDRYVVACKEAKDILIKEGIEEEKIRILGIPISVKFLNSYPKEEIAQKLGFINNLESVLIMGGGLGIGPIEKITRQLDIMDCNFQMIVICGRNKKLYSWFQRNRKKFKKPLFYFDYIDFVHEIMDFSDLIITKAGGVTVSEALAKGLAIIITNPIPGQEERNVNYLLKRKAIVKVDQTDQVGGAVKMLFEDKKKMYSLKAQAKEVSFIDSALRVVDLILGGIK